MSDVAEQSVNRWTPEMDAAIAQGHEQGLSARLIGEQLGVTRNSVLGRTFRLGLCKTIGEPRSPHVRKHHKSLTEVSIRKQMLPDRLIERISDLRELGFTWNQIAADLDVSVPTARNWAVKYGLLVPTEKRAFTPSDIDYIKLAWERNDPVEDIADKLQRSFGSIHQQVLKLQRRGDVGRRDPAKTMLLKRYGEAAMAAGATPSEALRNMQEAKTQAFAAAMNAANAAKRRHKDFALTAMRAAIAAGSDRNAAIFAARADGVNLEEIGAEIGVTRERVRQICNAYAQLIALKGLMA